jgi:hypothetical protein
LSLIVHVLVPRSHTASLLSSSSSSSSSS